MRARVIVPGDARRHDNVVPACNESKVLYVLTVSPVVVSLLMAFGSKYIDL